MTEDEARRVELVRAFEAEDRDELLLTREDRQQAEARARQLAGGPIDKAGEGRFLADRAEFAATRLATRHPGIEALLARTRWPRWLGWAVAVLAGTAGFFANELGTDKRLELLALPLLGTVAWNLAVYAALLIKPLVRRKPAPSRLVAWLTGLGQREFERGSATHRAAAAFRRRWAELSATINGARLARTLHLGAALFCAGLIAGIYMRALVIEYRAGWESTFLGPGAVHALLSTLLGPASAATGVAIPTVEGIAAMRWPASGTGGGVNAGPWLHLYTATLAGLVIVPRLVLALASGLNAFRLSRRFPTAGVEDFYVRRILRAAGGRAGVARITPYAWRPDEAQRARLESLLRRALGDGAHVRIDPPVEYGAEDAWLAGATLSPADDYHLVLYNLASTPEAENHGQMLAALAARVRREQPGTVVAALVDESPLRARFAGQGGLEQRIDTRAAAWREALAASGVVPLAVDLAQSDDEALAKRIESGLLPDGAMRG